LSSFSKNSDTNKNVKSEILKKVENENEDSVDEL